MEKKHPKGLWFIFSVELCERFAFYGMRAILMLYMVKHLMLGTKKAGFLYGWFNGLVYLTPLLGGYIADRYMGARKGLLVGMILIAAGTYVMGIESLNFFYLALVILIFGNGFYKPNAPALLGTLYDANDPRKDGAFTLFYMSVNIGAFFAPFICGYLGEKVGWKYGFWAAATGMVIGLMIYLWGQQKFLGNKGLASCYKPVNRNKDSKTCDKPLTKEEKQRVAVIFILMFFCIFFWSAFEQAGSSMTLFADSETNRMLFGWEIPASYFQSLNPLFIVIFAPIFSKMWVAMSERKINPSTPAKFVWGLLLLGIGFIFMAFAAYIYKTSGPVSMLWLVAVYLLHTLGELCVSPVGLSMTSKLSPIKFVSLLMAVWTTSSFFAHIFGGIFAANYDSIAHWKFYLIPAATAIGSALVLVFLVKTLKRWMHGIN